ncbi:MAG: hypothetical protein GOVbin2917_148 [Prokaryotic dsDNA virus sp.]|jgi:hypothetical protein|nr:MAG: hypothetical protein GOVbin2917_148 [Prokaryotic dsDNA virus sp.]|tara:strand:- start:15327 stop:15674 length:348 start_codon:yes stop_codon:yes gene_type:complete
MNNMTVDGLKKVVESLPDSYFGLGISSVHSWRGSYDEPAFTLEPNVSKQTMLNVIDSCLSYVFEGWKGGEFKYYDYSPVNFDTEGNYTEGGYLLKALARNPDNIFLLSIVLGIEE